jgi:type IV pilus assembly protein PilZ
MWEYSPMADSEHPRRGAPRAPIELKVEYQRMNSFFADYTRNISKGGTFIRTERPLAIGTAFLFKLSVPGLASALELNGKVQWTVQPGGPDDPGMGIGFVYDTEADRQRIEAVVERLMVTSLGRVLYDKLLCVETVEA